MTNPQTSQTPTSQTPTSQASQAQASQPRAAKPPPASPSALQAPQPWQTVADARNSPSALSPAPIRVFIVDDHPLVRDWLAALIKQQPDLEYIGQAGDAATALSAMLETPPDVAIVDITLPGPSGLDLIRNLTEQLPGTQAIVLTMHDELFYVERALRAGARGYVMKHESTSSILDAIRAVQSGRIHANPRLLANITQRIFGRDRSDAEIADKIGALSERELEVFQQLGRGRTTRQIAEALRLSIKTVQSYCVRIKEKLNLATTADLVYEAVSRHAKNTPDANSRSSA